mgnify:CR=1 FL=1
MNVNPNYEHIQQLIQEIEADMENYLEIYNKSYKNIVPFDLIVGSTRC